MMTPEQIEVFLREPHIAELATVKPDGSPHVAPVWFHYDGESVFILAETRAVKVRNIKHEPRVSISIDTRQPPVQYVIVDGVAELSNKGIPELLLTMSINYLGKEEGEKYAEKTGKEMEFVVIMVKPTKMISWVSEN